jgi:hypothetical protein
MPKPLKRLAISKTRKRGKNMGGWIFSLYRLIYPKERYLRA